MKKLTLSLLLVISFAQLTKAQLKVVSGNNISLGYSTPPSGQTEKLAVLGRSYFIESPALSGISIGNYAWSSSFNATSIIPQWNSSTLLGTPTERFFEVHTTQLYVNGVFITSDAKLKANIQKIASRSALSMVLKLNAYTYDFTEKNYTNVQKEMLPLLMETGKNQIGVMAQEVQEVLPQLVKQDEKTQQLSVNYVGLIPVLIESIKEQQQQITTQEKQIAAQQLQLEELKKQLELLLQKRD